MRGVREWGRLLIAGLAVVATGSCEAPGHASVESLQRSTVLVKTHLGHGSGGIIGPNRVLTAGHVLESEPVEVTFYNRETERAEVVWFHPKLDIAVLSVEVPEGYAPSPLSCEALVPGQHLILVSHPIHSRWDIAGGHLPDSEPVAGDLVAIGFPIGQGSGGGPVFDEEGRVVGVVLALVAERSSQSSGSIEEANYFGMGLMLPAETFCDHLVTPGPPEEDPLEVFLRRVEAMPEQLQADQRSEGGLALEGTSHTAARDSEATPSLLPFEKLAVKQQIAACWRLPPGVVGTEDMVVRLRIEVGRDRQVQRVTIEDDGRAGRDPVFRAVAQSAQRAVTSCGPLRLAPEKYDAWRDMVLNFRPEDAVRAMVKFGG